MTDSPAKPLVLINSGAYAHHELAAEFGALPPAFLPVGLERLYELQVRMFAGLDADVVLTLPESFETPAWDVQRLEALGVQVLRTADELPLGGALLFALGRIGFSDRPLRILHGDTVLFGVDLDRDDALAVAQGEDGYRWGQVTLDERGTIGRLDRPDWSRTAVAGPRLCGYFAFSSVARFAASLALSRGDIYDALNSQAADHGLSAVTPDQWLDFGHVQTFFRSRRIVTTARAFNDLQLHDMHVRKRSACSTVKLKAEARWLRDAPSSVSPFTARLLAEGEDERGYFYDTEYEYMPTLAELYVFGRLGAPSWDRVLASCGDFVEASVQAGGTLETPGLLRDLVVSKTSARLQSFAESASIDLDAPTKLNGTPGPTLRQCVDDIDEALRGCGDASSVMHGDLCFSNILYSFRTDRVRLIDPRGLTPVGGFSLMGDVRYDLAKLMHSMCGRYDLIIAGMFRGGRTGDADFELAFPDDPLRRQLETLAPDLEMGGVRLGCDVVWATMVSLFLSMAPLHADRPDRQTAFIANALRLRLAMDQGAHA